MGQYGRILSSGREPGESTIGHTLVIRGRGGNDVNCSLVTAKISDFTVKAA